MLARFAMACLAATAVVAGAPAAHATTSRPFGVPDSLRISASPYAGFQHCRPDVTGVVLSQSPTFAASPTTADGRYTPAPFRGLYATFEIAEPDGTALVSERVEIWPSGRVFAFGPGLLALPAGQYQWRVRADDNSATSAWSPWCGFTLEVPV